MTEIPQKSKNREISSFSPGLKFVKIVKKSGNNFIPFWSKIRANGGKPSNSFIFFWSQCRENGQ